MESYPSEASGGTDMLDIKSVRMEFPVDANIIVRQTLEYVQRQYPGRFQDGQLRRPVGSVLCTTKSP
jgi:hypothetical protein